MSASFRIKRRCALCVVLIGALLLCALFGCAPAIPGTVRVEEASLPLAIPPQTNEQWQALTLHIPSGGMRETVKKTAQVYVLEYESVYTAAVKELVTQMQSVSQQEGSGMPSLSVLSVAVCGESVVVNLSGNRAALEEAQLFTVLYGIVNTLTEFNQIRYVGVLWQDSAFTLEGMPPGMFTRFDSDVASAMNEYLQYPLKKLIRLYYQSRHSAHLMTEVREIRTVEPWAAVPEELFRQLLELAVRELSLGPRDTVNQARLLRSASVDSYRFAQNAEGKYDFVIFLSCAEDFFVQTGADPKRAAESLAMTLFDLVPEAASIAVAFNGSVGATLFRPQIELTLGEILSVYHPHENNKTIVRVNNVIDSYRSAQADGLLPTFFTQPAPEDFSATRILPEGTDGEDLELHYLLDTAYVEVSQRLYNALRAMDPAKERMTIYAIVNTLCESRGVRSVQFLMGAVPAANLPGRINLSEPLLFNPGIISP